MKVICVKCKKIIRDDKKNNKVSHGKCPVCFAERHMRRQIYKLNSVMINDFIRR